MKKISIILLVCCVLPLFQSCSTILSGTSDTVSVSSSVTADVVIVNPKLASEVASGKTPMSANLSRKNEYLVKIKASGFKEKIVPVTQAFNGWAVCNLGSLLGWLVDVISGAIWKLEPTTINVSLDRAYNGVGEERLYGTIRALDNEGQLREIKVPLEKEVGL